MKKKTVALLLALVLVVGAAVGGTMAYLIDTTEAVKNTFTAGDVDIDLEETTGTSYKMVPGATITKNPTVKVEANSEKCFVFVKLEKSTNFDNFMEYTMADGWTALDATNNPGVYYRVVDPTTENPTLSFSVLKDDQVAVKSEIGKDDMKDLTEATYPTLTITAYACQYSKDGTNNFTAEQAWEQVNPTSSK